MLAAKPGELDPIDVHADVRRAGRPQRGGQAGASSHVKDHTPCRQGGEGAALVPTGAYCGEPDGEDVPLPAGPQVRGKFFRGRA